MLKFFGFTNKDSGRNFQIDFTSSKQYDFNSQCVRNGIVKTAVVFGENNVGKTDLGKYLVDIYKNLYTSTFWRKVNCSALYEFEINSHNIIYEYNYNKTDNSIYLESLIIDNVVLFRKDNNRIENELPISEYDLLKLINTKSPILSYLNSNIDNLGKYNNPHFEAIKDLLHFVQRMLFVDFATMDIELFLERTTNSNNTPFLIIDNFDAVMSQNLAIETLNRIKALNTQSVIIAQNTSLISNDILRPDCYFAMTKEKICSFADSTEKELYFYPNLEK